MNLRPVFHLVAYLLAVIALWLAVCWGLARYFNDPASAEAGFVASAAVTLVAALVLGGLTRGPVELSRRDGFGIVAFGWLITSVFGSLPYLFSGVISNPVDAIFETMSGFTTTGATVLTDLEAIPHSILFWRSLTQWFGGMGVLVLCVAILPFLGVGGMQIYRAEMPGPSKDRLTPRIAHTAAYLWGVYVLLTILALVLLRAAGMDWFDAACHAFTTMSTGGFSTHTRSVAAFDSVLIESIIVVFMLLAGVNFALHYRALRGRPLVYARDPEARLYALVWIVAVLFLTLTIRQAGTSSLGAAFRTATFNCASILTTTGYATDNFDAWPLAGRMVLVLLMFSGGCAGSTAGGMKILRLQIMGKTIMRDIRTYMTPQAVIQVRMGEKAVEPDVVSTIGVFLMIFVLIFTIATLAMCLWMPDLESAATAVIATLGNIGPGLGSVGPTQTYAAIPAPGKAILTGCMLLGRLELFTVLVLFAPGFWRK